jgi:hypothetical protein
LSLLDEVGQVVKERAAKYGSPVINMKRIAAFWSVYLGNTILPEDVPQMMVLMKIAREMNQPDEDNTRDAAGYAYCWDLCVKERLHETRAVHGDGSVDAQGVPAGDGEEAALLPL